MKRPLFLSLLILTAITFLPGSAKAQLQWTVVTPAPSSNNLTSVIYANGQYVAVGDGGMILTSPDGIAWSKQITGMTYDLWSITYGNSRYMVVGNYLNPGPNWFKNFSLSSSDGIAWTSNIFDSIPSKTSAWTYVTYVNGLYVIFSYNGPYLAGSIGTSTSGLSWAWSGLGPIFHSLVYTNGTYVYAGGLYLYQGAVIYVSNSTPPSTGVKRTVGTGQALRQVIYGDSQYVVVGDNGTILTSTDDSIWIIQPIGILNSLYSVTYNNGQYVTVGTDGIILNSPDAINWALDSSGTVNQLNSVATNGSGQFVAVGNSGTIVYTSGASSIKTASQPATINTVIKVNTRNSFFSISLPSALLGKAVDLGVYTASGRVVAQKRISHATDRFTLPAPNLALGTYILSVKAGTQKQAVRFVVVR